MHMLKARTHQQFFLRLFVMYIERGVREIPAPACGRGAAVRETRPARSCRTYMSKTPPGRLGAGVSGREHAGPGFRDKFLSRATVAYTGGARCAHKPFCLPASDAIRFAGI